MTFKTLSLAAALALSAGAAAADSYFAFGETLEDRATVELGTVLAEADGVVEIYNVSGGQTGALLGTTPVFAGANQDVRVQIGAGYRTDVLAVLKIGDEIVATQDYDIDNG